MLSNEEYREVLQEEGEAGLYMDPKLSPNKKSTQVFLTTCTDVVWLSSAEMQL